MILVLDGDDNRLAQSSVERERLWTARRSFAKVLMATPQNFFSEDVSVPIDAVPKMLQAVRHLAAETGSRFQLLDTRATETSIQHLSLETTKGIL